MGSTSYVLHFPIFNSIRHNLLTTLDRIDCKILEPVNSSLANFFLGSASFDTEETMHLPNTNIVYISSNEIFEEPIL